MQGKGIGVRTMLNPFAGYCLVEVDFGGRIGVLPFLLGLLVRLGGIRRSRIVGGLLALGLFSRCGLATSSKTMMCVLEERTYINLTQGRG